MRLNITLFDFNFSFIILLVIVTA